MHFEKNSAKWADFLADEFVYGIWIYRHIPSQPDSPENHAERAVNVRDYIAGMIDIVISILSALFVALHIKYHTSAGSTFLFGVIVFTASLTLLPFLLPICGIFAIYRQYVKKQLEKQPGFKGLMDGSDAYWAGEQVYARSIITCLLFIDFGKQSRDEQKHIEVLRENTKYVIDSASYKMKCKKRLSKFGYWYLEECDIDLNKITRHIDLELRDKADLEEYASKIANEPIIEDYLWEILVGRQEVNGAYPVFVRADHSLGDGYALVRLFVDYMSDKQETMVHKFVKADSVFQRLVNGDYRKMVVRVICLFLNHIVTFINISIVLARNLLSPIDSSASENSLHSRIYLSGKKVCRYMDMELEFVKEVKNSLNVRFSDVLLTAVSNSLESCFEKWGGTVDRMGAVIPARLPIPLTSLTNLFTVVLLDLPITGKDKLETIHVAQERYRASPEFHVNYWVLQFAFTIFPATFISKYFVSTRSSLLISNVQGAEEHIIVRGSVVTDMAFFLPNRDTTGVGISFLSYADRFSIGVIVDESLIASSEQVDEILRGIFQSINEMHRSHERNSVKP
ncbi:hypothetical protein GE061_013085 [Apolygus lucorum]|uniref:O-acyltransferase WSD1 C-terminal domain-containing protein n=1 Tax=Apolygus lucorum TaxID=248454 RepID=A0A8S9XU53_APOLU|nr:hypothetical protein GE061_013085 [Apolygus lucorum]